MYLKEGANYPNLDTDEFSCYLIGRHLEDIKKLFVTAVHQTGVNPADLVVMAKMVSESAHVNNVLSHMHVAEFEQKAIFVTSDIMHGVTLPGKMMKAFLTELTKNPTHSIAQTKFKQLLAGPKPNARAS